MPPAAPAKDENVLSCPLRFNKAYSLQLFSESLLTADSWWLFPNPTFDFPAKKLVKKRFSTHVLWVEGV